MATSKLQIIVGDLLDKAFPQFTIRENYRPYWLASSNNTILELDFYIEELKVAFEIQGDQHFKFIPFFHGTQEKFEKSKQYDAEKSELCAGSNVRLIEIFTQTDAIVEIKNIQETLGPGDYLSVIGTGYGKKSQQKIKEKSIKKQVSRLHIPMHIPDNIKSSEIKYHEAMQFIAVCKKYFCAKKGIPNFRFDFLDLQEQKYLISQMEYFSTE